MDAISQVVQDFLMLLFNTLRAKSPKDTGNMLAHIVYNPISPNEIRLTISAPKAKSMDAHGKVIEASDYAFYVNYSRLMAWGKKPNRNRYWVEQCIMQTKRIISQNIRNGIYADINGD